MKNCDSVIWTAAIVTGVAILASVIVSVESCSCLPAHIQEHYCNADFVILARVKREKHLNGTLIYKIQIRKGYKLSEKAVVALKSGRIITADSESMCGVSLEIGRLYALTGRIVSLKAYISYCDFIQNWENLTKKQRKGLKKMYSHGCTCKIRNCYGRIGCIRDKDSCNWSSPCHDTEGICLRGRSKSCMWVRNQNLTKCLKSKNRPIP